MLFIYLKLNRGERKCYRSLVSLCQKKKIKVIFSDLKAPLRGLFHPDKNLIELNKNDIIDPSNFLLTFAHEYYHALLHSQRRSYSQTVEFKEMEKSQGLLVKEELKELLKFPEKENEYWKKKEALISKAELKLQEEEIAASFYGMDYIASNGLFYTIEEITVYKNSVLKEIREVYSLSKHRDRLEKIKAVFSQIKREHHEK